jgi:quercetin dioxygenase-like cupin family protein
MDTLPYHKISLVSNDFKGLAKGELIKMKANVVRQKTGKFINLGPSQILVKEDGTLTRNTLSLIEVEVSPSTQLPPPHIHRGFEELFYILEGEIEFIVEEEIVPAFVGDVVTIPSGVPHTYGNVSDQKARILIFHTDARMVKFFEETESLIQSGVPAPQAINQLLPKYNTDPVPAK